MAEQLPFDLRAPADPRDLPESPIAPRLQLVPHGPPARAALFAAVTAAQADDPLAPVTVAVPSPLAGLALRRALGAKTGLLNVHFTALARVAELLGAPALAAQDRRPLAGPLRAEAVHAVLIEEPGILTSVAGHPSTVQHLTTTFAELARVTPAARRAVAERSERAATVVRLFAAYQDRIAGYYDEDDLVAAAAAAVADGTAPAAELGHLVVHLPLDLSPGETALIEALAARDRCTVLLGLTGDPVVDAAQADVHAARLRPALGAPAAPTTAPPAPVADAIVSAPDPEDEVRAVVRQLVERSASGASLAGAAILYRAPEPYARVLPEVLDAAGVPWNGPSPRRVADGAAGRVLLGLLALPESELSRDDVAAWLASGPVRDPVAERRVNAARWDALSRQAGIVRGAAQWAERLAAFRESVDSQLARLRVDGDDSEWQTRRLERDRDDATALDEFIADLAVRVTAPEEPTWADLAQWARELHDHYLGREGHRGDWPDSELTAARRVEEALDELGGLDAFDDRADLARFRRALAIELDTPVGRVGRYGTGVLIGQLGQAYASDLDVVYVLGGAEGTLPPRGREDPLLPDRDRRDVPGFALHADRRLEERRDYLAALASAHERVLTFPRADPRAQRKRLPARWVLESARALGAEHATAEQLRDEIAAPWLKVVQSFADLVTHGAPGSVTEYRLQTFARWRAAHHALAEHPLAAGSLAGGFVAASERASGAATAFDGFIGSRPGLAPGAARPTSPTALQDWAACPFRYFLRRVLRLRVLPRPEETETISAMDRGSLIHAILEEFVREAAVPATPDELWTAEDQARLALIVARHCADAEARGITGRAISWELVRRGIAHEAKNFLAADEGVRARYGVLPAPDGLERAFGDDGQPPVDVEVADGRRVTFRGRIDRVDRSPDGRRVVVYDYKTGSGARYPKSFDDDPVGAGHYLQLPVYALAASEREGAVEVSANYWFTGADPSDPLLGLDLDAARARFVDVVGTIAAGVEGGCFPASPGQPHWEYTSQRDTFESCKYCEFDQLCPGDRGTAWDRKSSEPEYEPCWALELPEPDGAEESS